MKRSVLSRIPVRCASVLLLALLPMGVLAHPGHSMTAGWGSGLTHPLTGLDHLLAMVAVGLWATQLGGRALWLLPASFMGVMALGGWLGAGLGMLPGIEAMVLASVFILGLMLATAARAPLWLAAGMTGIFALAHGAAHGAEMGAGTSGLAYGGGFLLATGLLHLAGVGLGFAAQRVSRPTWLQYAGWALVASSGALCLSA